jgi:transketolase
MNSSAHLKTDLQFFASEIARTARISALQMTSVAKTSHIGACLSVIDILSTLFTLKHREIKHSNDNIILSKGHAAAALYSVLKSLKLLESNLSDYCKNGSQIYGHIDHHTSAEIPLSAGSLGHGFPFGLGMALAAKKKGTQARTYVVVSDGELNEGTTWESALVAGHHKLNNLTVIIDRNRIQSLGFTEAIVKLDPIAPKWEAFGWATTEIDGHDIGAVLEALKSEYEKPLCIIANTVKGKGVSFMENTLEWHYQSPSPEQLNAAIQEVSGNSS